MKKIIATLTLCILCTIGAIGLIACGNSDKGTYYKYSNGDYDKKSYITLEGSTWKDDDGATGTYQIKDGKITFYITIYGFKEEFADGTIKDGVMEINGKIYCKEGCTPSPTN